MSDRGVAPTGDRPPNNGMQRPALRASLMPSVRQSQ